MLIILQDQDLAFAKIAQGARVDGATLPSGLKVPVTPGKKWIICEGCIRCIDESQTHETHAVQAELPE